MRIFVTGIGTDVGKTVASAILVEALEADYWKPVQAGSLDTSDSEIVRSLITNNKSHIHPESYRLTTACSPHAAAQIDSVKISLDMINAPQTTQPLIIEGAGGLLVPLASDVFVADLVLKLEAQVIVVARSYLGSINHTLLTCEALKRRGISVLGIIFNGEENAASESIIIETTGLRRLGSIGNEKEITQAVVSEYAQRFRQVMHFLLRLRHKEKSEPSY